jgi:hypothetical protein
MGIERDELTPGHWRFRRKYGELHDSMEPKEALVLEALAELHRMENERFYERRRIEWRLAFTLWAGVAVVGALVLDHVPSHASQAVLWALAIGFAILPVLHFVFERGAFVDGAIDSRNRGYAMSNAALVRLGWRPTFPLFRYRTYYAHYSLVAVTAVLAATVVLLLAAETRDYWMLAASAATVVGFAYLDLLVRLTKKRRHDTG